MMRLMKFLVLVAVVFGVAFGLQALSRANGEIALTVGDTVYAVSLTVGTLAALALILVAMGLLWFLAGLLTAPWRIAQGVRRRNRERGREAVANGLIAIAAGDLRAAERAMLDASRRAPDQPLTRLLQAQTAQLRGERGAAREIFKDMVEDPATRIAGLRGLYIEAEREGESEAAHRIAARAREEAPSAAWAVRALLRHQSAAGEWDAALATLAGATDGRILDKRTARRLRAVLLTAKALQKEEGEPEAARPAAQEAHDLAPDLVPAAVVAGRLFARQGDVRRATRILEASWKANPHPETADAYTHVRAGDSALDRLKRAETLLRMRSSADEGRQAVARAAIDARDFARARAVLEPIIAQHPTRRTLVLMAELEQAESGDSGRARGWLARAAYAPHDPAWVADGQVLEEWAPLTPGGKLDGVEWKVPLTELEAPRLDILPEPPSSGLALAPPADPPAALAAATLAQPGAASETFEAPPPAAATPKALPVFPLPAKPAEPAPAAMPPPHLKVAVLHDPIEGPRPDDPGIGGEDVGEDAATLPTFLRSG